MVGLDLTSDDLERSNQGHDSFKWSISWQECTLDLSIVLQTHRKPYAGSPVVVSDLTSDDLERSNQGHGSFNL